MREVKFTEEFKRRWNPRMQGKTHFEIPDANALTFRTKKDFKEKRVQINDPEPFIMERSKEIDEWFDRECWLDLKEIEKDRMEREE